MRELERQLVAAQQQLVGLRGELKELRAREGRDTLTGLANLRSFHVRLEGELDRSRRYARPLTVALLDLDGFRSLNANYGYGTADRMLCEVAQVIKRSTRAQDLACRTGADEFALLMVETDPEGALECFERVFLELEVVESGGAQCPSASVGVAAFERGETLEQLLARAGNALDRARAAGGGRAVTAGSPSVETDHGVDPGMELDAIKALAVTLLERDQYTGEHSETVVEMSARVASALGTPGEEIKNIKSAALLHDIGKVAIPDEILKKPGRLTDEEWKLMREHPVIGERILRAIPGLGGVARIVRHEHERWDGKGYPDGLKEEEIPLGSRIILACDTYHAMTSDRPYRDALPHEAAVRELSSNAGTQFDPDVTAALIGYLHGRRQAHAAPTGASG